jgi:tRNA(Ser,Leu) C12 N-acetylase TAN1
VKDWNVIITVFQDGFRRALRALRELGPIERSPYHNVLVMKVDDPVALLATIELRTEQSTALYDAISRVASALRNFDFQSGAEFLVEARVVVNEWSPGLAGRSFHVRLHRRGTKHDLGTQDTEHLLNDAVIEATKKAGMPAKISFTDPDAVIAIDTIDDRAGLALWTREDCARHRLLRPD